jgi:hypothetical protein
MLKILKPALAPGRAFNFKTNKKIWQVLPNQPKQKGSSLFLPLMSMVDLHPRQGNLLHGNIFTGLNKTSLRFTK